MSRRANVAAVMRGLRAARAGAERERWPRERLTAWQAERADALIRHAAAHSPLLRERLTPGEPLARQPVMTKADVAERFDELVCDPALRSRELLAWLDGREQVERYAGRYRVMATSGSSGRKGLFAYDEQGWDALIAQFFRHTVWQGFTPRLPRRRRVAALVGAAPTHMSRQCTATIDVGVHRTLTLPASAPVPELVEAIRRLQPDLLAGFPSTLALLAAEQRAGRLRIAPSFVTTTSELRTPETTEALRAAFGVAPFDLYGTTEGLWGLDCEHHVGIHLFEDHVIVENVDEAGRPVEPGVRGAKLLLTNLANRVQPIIRLEVSDCVTLAADPCPCGRTLVRTQSIDGRADDVLALPAADGGTVQVPPIAFGFITRDAAVREFQVRQEPDRLRVLVVTATDGPGDVEDRLRATVTAHLAALGARIPVAVERREALERVGGKLRMVVALPDAALEAHVRHGAGAPA